LSAIFFTLISTALASAIYNVNFFQIENFLRDFSDPRALDVLKLVQTMSAIGAFIVPAFLIAYLFDRRPLHYLKLDRNPDFLSVIFVLLAILFSTPLINYLGHLNSYLDLPGFLQGVEDWMQQTEEQAGKMTKAFLDMRTPGELFFNLFMIGLIPAVGEELLFRGIIQKLFTKWSNNIHTGIWVAAFLFSAMHMQFYGFLPRMILGVILGYLFVWSGSIWLPIIAHFINNAGAVISSYLFQRGQISVDPDAIGTQNDAGMVMISLLTTLFLLFLVNRRERARAEATGLTG
jgi:uncharacterized protein